MPPQYKPSSRSIAGIGSILYVIGRHRMIAISAVKPGMAPIMIPASRPMKIAMKLSAEAISAKPVIKLFNICASSFLWQSHAHCLKCKVRNDYICTGNRIEPPFSRTEIQQNAIGKQQRGNDKSNMRKQQRVCDQHGNIDYRFQPQQIFFGKNGS